MNRVAVYLAVAFVALLVRWPALRPNPTPDACEYQMLARSLAQGRGYTLPVRVRHDVAGPVAHDARAERAPAFPVFLAGCVALGIDDDRGAISPSLQICNAVLGVACALVVTWMASGRARLAAGLVAALCVPLCYSSVRLLAEPLGVLLVLLALRADAVKGVRGAIASGGLVALARLARPELAIVVAVVVGARALRREWKLAGACLGAFAVVSVVALAFGFGAPQGFLFRVGSFRDVMFAWGHAPPPAPSAFDYVTSEPSRIARLVGTNAWDLLVYAVRWGGPLVFVPLFARTREERITCLAAIACAVGAALVWSTRDHSRFLVAPLVLLAVVVPAALEELASRRAWVAMLLLLLAPPVVHHVREIRLEARPNPTWAGEEVDALAAALRSHLKEGEAFAAVSPWSLALASGRPGLLLPNELSDVQVRELLRAHPEVKVVVLRPAAPHDSLTPEPVHYARAIAEVSRCIRVSQSDVFLIR